MNRKYNQSMDTAAVTLIFCIFAAALAMVVLSGASVYKNITERIEENCISVTAAGYISEKIRHFDESGAVSAGKFGDSDALVLSETIDGEKYTVNIYCYDGWIRELFAAENSGIEADAGEKIMRASGMKTEIIQNEMLKITVILEDGKEIHTVYTPRSVQTA